jgi:RNA-directed DNA polymerase
MSRRRKSPFARRGYLHFDEPVGERVARVIATSPATVEKWSFLPFLRHDIKLMRTREETKGCFTERPKDRPICYAAHKDAAIYAWYGTMLTDRYEQRLADLGLSACVTAFRPNCGKSNIDHAAEVFQWIRTCGTGRAFAFDITSFFDRLEHSRLKSQWTALLGEPRLPNDHFAIFRSITRHAYVQRQAAYTALGISKHNPRAGQRRKLCTPLQFRTLIRDAGLIQINTSGCGIPQGSPMSAVLSNIYMLDFDCAVAAWVAERGGIYRRYCDDILVAVPSSCTEDVEAFVGSQIENLVLEIQPAKTTSHHFDTCSGQVRLDTPLSYLGLVFDGARVLLRTVAISRYYSKLRSGVRLAAQTKRKHNLKEQKNGVRKTPLKTRKLYVLYSYVGRHNFTSYAYRAARTLGSPAIKKQIKRHWQVLQAEIAKSIAKYRV